MVGSLWTTLQHIFTIFWTVTYLCPVWTCLSRSCIDERLGPLWKVFSSTSHDSGSGLDSVVVNPRSLNHSLTIWAQLILALSSWNMLMSSGKKKSNDGITGSFSIQVVSWLHNVGKLYVEGMCQNNLNIFRRITGRTMRCASPPLSPTHTSGQMWFWRIKKAF